MSGPRPALVSAIVIGATLLAGCPRSPEAQAPSTAVEGRLLHADSFHEAAGWQTRWVVEQLPGGEVTVADGRMTIRSTGGTTVWFATPLQAPLVISYDAIVSSQARVSDLNCFWMASDPTRSDGQGAPFGRSGRFADYDSLQLYYVGYGGNTNTTTRFRRYLGDGTKPLLPDHDRTAPEFLLVPDHTYAITIIVADGRTRFLRDGEVIFEFADPAPLTSGWFGFRTVDSRIEIRNFRVHKAAPGSASR